MTMKTRKVERSPSPAKPSSEAARAVEGSTEAQTPKEDFDSFGGTRPGTPERAAWVIEPLFGPGCRDEGKRQVVAAIRAETARLRAALEDIANGHNLGNDRDFARRVLNGEPE